MADNDFWEEQLRNWVEQSSNKNSARALSPKTMSGALTNRSKVKRMSLLPYPQLGADGSIDMTDWVAPQVAVDLIESAQLPGQVYRGEKAGTPEEARKMAVDVNFGSALLGKAPVGAIASGVARRAANDLPMDEASRMARAGEMGFDTDAPLYHGTSSDIAAFDPALRGDATAARTAKMATWMTDDPTTARGYAEHSALSAPVSRKIKEAGVAEDAGDWDLYDAKLIEAEKLEKQFSEQRLQGQNIMPVYAPKVGQDRTIWNRGDVDAEGLFVKNMKGKSFDDTGVSDDIQTILQGARRDGYAGVKFLNLDDAIGMGARPATHVAVFNPSDIRSKHAKFDPAKRNSADLLASNPGDPLSAAAALQKQYEDEQLLKFLETGA